MSDDDLIRRGDAIAKIKEYLTDTGSELELWDIDQILNALPAVSVGVKSWGYCPECGEMEIHYERGNHKQCAKCYQEWFSDIDYSEVVRGNLNRLFRAALTPAPTVDVKELVEALKGIDALDPESLVSGCSRDALSGLVNLMGAKARAALAAFEKENGK